MFARNGIMKTALYFLIVATVCAAFFAASHVGMDAQMGGQMGPCPLMPGVVICNMTPLQHIAAAQTMFTALPRLSDILSLLLLLLAAVIAAAFLSRNIFPPPKSTLPRRFAHRNEHVPFSSLLEAFSNGIIHSKAF